MNAPRLAVQAAGALRRGISSMRVHASSVRTYATSAQLEPVAPRAAKQPKVFPYHATRSKLSDRKTYLYGKYKRLLHDSELVVLFETSNMSVPLMEQVRQQMNAVKIPEADLARLEEKNGGAPWDMPKSSLMLARTGLMRPVCRTDSSEAVQKLGPYLHGQIAMLVCPVLSPEYVGNVLRAMERPVAAAAAAIDPKSGKKPPKLAPLVAVAERSRIVDARGLPELTKLPNLATLRAQLVGLLSAPGQQLAGVLSQAGGGTIALTLDARRRDLEKAQ